MSITQEEFRKRIHEIIQDKIFFSNISNNPVEVVEKLPGRDRARQGTL